MSVALAIPDSVLLVSGAAVIIACGLITAALIAGTAVPRARRVRFAPLEQERDLASALGWPWRRWVALRAGLLVVAVAVGAYTGVWLVVALLAVGAVAGVRFAFAGRAMKRRLRMERAFLTQLRVLRERMALAHQSLDTALPELAASAGRELQHVLAPLQRGGSTSRGIVECGSRSRSALVESSCAVLLWARTRSIAALIDTIDGVLLPVGEAQLAVEEESLVTLTQQRAVIFAMSALMAAMLASLLRVDSFRAYYETAPGTVVLLAAIAIFCGLTVAVGRIVRVDRWTRWDLAAMHAADSGPHA